MVPPHRYKKNIKALYIVHPTMFIKTLLILFKPIIRSAGRAGPGLPMLPLPGQACLQGWGCPASAMPCIPPHTHSFKFGQKIFYVNYLSELSEHVKLEQLGIPRQVLK